MSRTNRLVVLGTRTEVGKTWVGAALVSELRSRGLMVLARKPLQSFDPADPGPTDAEVLAGASGEPPTVVCAHHGSFEVPMAPPMAADALGRPLPRLAELVADLPVEDADLVLVETVGGVMSPLTSDADSADLARALQPAVPLLVADAGLGSSTRCVRRASRSARWSRWCSSTASTRHRIFTGATASGWVTMTACGPR
ncbi:MAG: ATP-dependent dethiobiotin synthetase BioD [Microthrixaceae bacterium]